METGVNKISGLGAGKSFAPAKCLNIAEAAEKMNDYPLWRLNESGGTISRDFEMKNFKAGVELIDRIALLAEEENHHPDIHLTGYRNLRVELSTHDAGGVTEKNFDMAGKIDCLPADLKK